MGDTYQWTGGGDGDTWSDPSNWEDTTTGEPATQAPTAADGDPVNFYTDATLTGGGSALYFNLYATLTVTGATITTTDDMAIGLTGTAVMNIGSGASVTAGTFFQIGGEPGATGTVNVDGSGTTLTADDVFTVGAAGTGTLDLTNGASAITRNGFEVGSSISDNDTVPGTGYFNIDSGSSASGDWADVADPVAGSNGEITVSGTGSSLSLSEFLEVGAMGTGAVTVEDGGTLNLTNTTSTITLAIGVDSSGTGTVGLEATSVSVGGGGAVVGYEGDGALTLVDGATVTITSAGSSYGKAALDIGTESGGTGTVSVVGSGSSLTATGEGTNGLIVGDLGSGSLSVIDGASVTTSSSTPASDFATIVGNGGDSSGTLIVDGIVSTFNSGAGGMSIGSTGQVAVADDGTLNVSGFGDLGVNGILNIEDGGTVNTLGNSGVIVGSGGAIGISDATLTSYDGMDIAGGGSLDGNGAINLDDGSTLTLDGTFTADGGTLALYGGFGTGGSGQLQIDNQSTLQLNGSLVNAPTIAFTGGGLAEDLQITDTTTSVTTPIDGFTSHADTIDLSFLADGSNTATATLNSSDDVLTVSAPGGTVTLQLDTGESYSGLTFLANEDSSGGTEVTIACYRLGTRIRTVHGEVPVEELQIGEDVMTVAGIARPIKWIGQRSYSGRFASGNKKILPVCFKPGSLAEGMPKRNLWVSPNHAMYIDGLLIQAEDLVNGDNVVQAEAKDTIRYFHIELESHDVILAEGAWSETFIDDHSRMMFHNAADYFGRYPNAPDLPPLYCAPRVNEGFQLQGIRDRIRARGSQQLAVAV